MKTRHARPMAPWLSGMFAVWFAHVAAAGSAPTTGERSILRPTDSIDYLSFSGGYVGVFRDTVGAAFSVQYLFHENFHGVHPEFLLGATSHSQYLNLTLLYSLPLRGRWFCNISTGPGLYRRDDRGDDLGTAVEFLSGISVGRSIGRGQLISLGISHISNAHLGSKNHGNELVRLIYSLPVSR